MNDSIRRLVSNCKTGEEALEVLKTQKGFIDRNCQIISDCMAELQISEPLSDNYNFWADQLKQQLEAYRIRSNDYRDMATFFQATMPLAILNARRAKEEACSTD